MWQGLTKLLGGNCPIPDRMRQRRTSSDFVSIDSVQLPFLLVFSVSDATINVCFSAGGTIGKLSLSSAFSCPILPDTDTRGLLHLPPPRHSQAFDRNSLLKPSQPFLTCSGRCRFVGQACGAERLLLLKRRLCSLVLRDGT